MLDYKGNTDLDSLKVINNGLLFAQLFIDMQYGNKGCRVFKGEYKIRKIFGQKSISSKEIIVIDILWSL